MDPETQGNTNSKKMLLLKQTVVNAATLLHINALSFIPKYLKSCARFSLTRDFENTFKVKDHT